MLSSAKQVKSFIKTVYTLFYAGSSIANIAGIVTRNMLKVILMKSPDTTQETAVI
jgi:hypothetical protein